MNYCVADLPNNINALALDEIALTQKLIAYPSVSPARGEIFDFVENLLQEIGLNCTRLPFGKGDELVDNLYAEYIYNPENLPESQLFHLSFCGHLDVVPAGDETQWQSPAFTPTIIDNRLVGRGAVDMKSAVASWIVALNRFVTDNKTPIIISMIITGDEEDKAINGVRKIVPYLQTQGKKIDFCITGEPTSKYSVGDTMKIGRRGSFNGRLTIHGKQGHVAYPEQCANAAHALTRILQKLIDEKWDNQPDDAFPPSSLQITTIDIGNQVSNISPNKAVARFNIRYNHQHDGESLKQEILNIISQIAPHQYDKNNPPETLDYSYQLETSYSNSFYCKPDTYHAYLRDAIQTITGFAPEYSTEGGISDSRFLAPFCQVVDFGLCNAQMHQNNESVKLADIRTLTNIYHAIISQFAKKSAQQ
ncbi:MAG: succinyl-diaminopimelate desuccinylase [Alphaproteobacteria bacterium]|nr:succinyl-diaminopimelate desuccinylase [Alphaproteobacteria bacterium]